MELDDRSRECLMAALLERGWYLESDFIMAPKRTMWLMRESPWQGDLADMLERMRGRLDRVRRFAADNAAEGCRETIDDTQSVVDCLESLFAGT